MLIPMEILSQMMTRTDSGAGVRQRAGPGSENGSRFERIFEEAMSNSQSEPYAIKKETDTAANKKEAASTNSDPPVKSNKPDKIETNGEELAAGVMGTTQEIVFILEGDKESATEPELQIRIPDEEPATDRKPEPENKSEPKTEAPAVETKPVEETAVKPQETETKIETNTEAKIVDTKNTDDQSFGAILKTAQDGENNKTALDIKDVNAEANTEAMTTSISSLNKAITNEMQGEPKQIEYVRVQMFKNMQQAANFEFS